MDKKFAALISIFVVGIILFISIVAFNEPLRRFTSAKEEFAPSATASIIFAWPISAKAGEKIDISVFVRSETGKPLSSKRVNVTSTLGQISEVTPNTDKTGKASFILSSSQDGIAEISATVEGTVPLSKSVTVTFE